MEEASTIPRHPNMGDYVSLNERTELSLPLRTGSLVVLHSHQLNPTPEPQAYIDNTNLNIYNEEGSNILHISFRRAENEIVFNTAPEGNNWEQEERVPLSGKLRRNDTYVIVWDQGDYYQVFIDGFNAKRFTKRYGGNGVAVSYEVNEYTQNPIFSHTIDVQPVDVLG